MNGSVSAAAIQSCKDTSATEGKRLGGSGSSGVSSLPPDRPVSTAQAWKGSIFACWFSAATLAKLCSLDNDRVADHERCQRKWENAAHPDHRLLIGVDPSWLAGAAELGTQ